MTSRTVITGIVAIIFTGLGVLASNLHAEKAQPSDSLFATSSLVMIFFAEALSHLGLRPEWVLIAQAYLLWTMLYIVYSKKKDGNQETE